MANINWEFNLGYVKIMVVFVAPVLIANLLSLYVKASASFPKESLRLRMKACARVNLPATPLLEVGADLYQIPRPAHRPCRMGAMSA